MNEWKLTLPPDNFTLDDAYKAGKNSDSLAGVVMDVIVEKGKNLRLKHNVNQTKHQQAEEACKAINRNFKETREEIDWKVVEYLRKHDWKADSWPDCTGLDEMAWKGLSTIGVIFDYFGDDFEVTDTFGQPVICSKSQVANQLVYRNTYKATDTSAYLVMKGKLDNLLAGIEEIGEARMRCLPILCLFFLLLTLPLGFASFALLAEMATRYVSQGPFRQIMMMWIAKLGQGSLRERVVVVYRVLIMPAEEFYACGIIGRVLYALVTFGLTLIPLSLLIRHCVLYVRKKKIKRFCTSREYKTTVEENEQWRKASTELSEQWHRAWFEWVRTYKGKAGLTETERIMQDFHNREQEREIQEEREKIKNDFHVEIPQEMDPREWRRRCDLQIEKYLREYAQNGETEVEQLPKETRIKIWLMALRDMKKAGMAKDIVSDKLGLSPEEAEEDLESRAFLRDFMEVDIHPSMTARRWMELFDEKWAEYRSQLRKEANAEESAESLAEKAKGMALEDMLRDGMAVRW